MASVPERVIGCTSGRGAGIAYALGFPTAICMPDLVKHPRCSSITASRSGTRGACCSSGSATLYEMFDDDAVAVSKAIGLTLTQRTAGVPCAACRTTSSKTYLKKLIDRGFWVAVCEQTELAENA